MSCWSKLNFCHMHFHQKVNKPKHLTVSLLYCIVAYWMMYFIYNFFFSARRLSSFGVLGTRSNSLTLFPVMLQSVPTRKFINLAAPILARRMEYSENRTIRWECVHTHHFVYTSKLLQKVNNEVFLSSYSVEQIFSIVANVDQYHQFVPWCKRSKVIKRRNGYVQAELEIGFPPIIERYVSDVTVIPNHQVRVRTSSWVKYTNLWKMNVGYIYLSNSLHRNTSELR